MQQSLHLFAYDHTSAEWKLQTRTPLDATSISEFHLEVAWKKNMYFVWSRSSFCVQRVWTWRSKRSLTCNWRWNRRRWSTTSYKWRCVRCADPIECQTRHLVVRHCFCSFFALPPHLLTPISQGINTNMKRLVSCLKMCRLEYKLFRRVLRCTIAVDRRSHKQFKHVRTLEFAAACCIPWLRVLSSRSDWV